MGINFSLSSYIITFLVVERIVVLSSTDIATVVDIYNHNRGIYQIMKSYLKQHLFYNISGTFCCA
jgi:hypothetical protein